MSVSVGIMAEIHIAKQFEADGYTVMLNPGKNSIPFNLERYTPDILATRGDENILIEVKTSKARFNSEKLFKISKMVESHPGWKFSVVTVNEDDISEFKEPAPEHDIFKISQTLTLIKDNLTDSNVSVFFVPQIWICYFSILSIILRNEAVKISGLSSLSILNAAYSEGIIDYEELQSSRQLLSLRNFVCHNCAGDVSNKDVKGFFDMTLSVLEKYRCQIID